MRALWRLTVVQAKLFLREPMGAFFTLLFAPLVLILFGFIYGNDPEPLFGGRGSMDISVPGREISADSDARRQGGRDELRETLSALVGWRAELRGRDGKLKADPRAMEDLNERMSRSFMMRGGQAQALGKMMGPLLLWLLPQRKQRSWE